MTETAINPEINATRLDPPTTVSVEPSMNTYQNFPALSYSDAVTNFTIIPPSMKTYLNRRIPIHFPIRITFVGTNSHNAVVPPAPEHPREEQAQLLQSGCEALRAAAGLRIIQNMNFSINGIPIPCVNPFDVLSELVTHYDDSYRDEAPLSAPDVTALYEASYGATNNPLATYSSSTSPKEMKRGAYPITIVENTPTSAIIDFDLIEWLYLPKFMGTNCEKKVGLTNAKIITLVLNTNLDKKYLWSHSAANGSTITSATAIIRGQPSMMCKFLTPPSTFPQIDAEYEYLYCEKYLTANNTAMTSHTAVYTLTSNNVQLSEIPKFLMLYVRPSDSEKTLSHTDTFCKIEQVNIMFNNVANLLSTADNRSLYEMSSDCGLLDSYQAFNGSVEASGGITTAGLPSSHAYTNEITPWTTVGAIGSVVMLQFGRHISLSSENLSIGKVGNFNMQVAVQAKNIIKSGGHEVTITNPVLYVVPIYERTIQVTTQGNVNVLTKESKLQFQGYGTVGQGTGRKARSGGAAVYETTFGGATDGGSISDIINFIKDNKLVSKGLNVVGDVMGAIPQSAAYSGIPKTISAAADAVGYGTLSKADLKRRIMKL